MSAPIGKAAQTDFPARIDWRNTEARDNKWRLEVDRALLALTRRAPDKESVAGPRGRLAEQEGSTARNASDRHDNTGQANASPSTGRESDTSAGMNSLGGRDMQVDRDMSERQVNKAGADHSAVAGTPTAAASTPAAVANLPADMAASTPAKIKQSEVAQHSRGGVPAEAGHVTHHSPASSPLAAITHAKLSITALHAASLPRQFPMNAHAQPVTEPTLDAASAHGLTPAGTRAEQAGPAQRGQQAGSSHDGEPYADRNVHVLLDESGAHAYLRDAHLDLDQMSFLAQAVYAQGVHGETNLATVTVNGRLMEKNAFYRASMSGTASSGSATVIDNADVIIKFEQGESRHDDQRR
jgi:hypothetical protein